MRFTSALSFCLIGALAFTFSASVDAAISACQMCVNDVAKSIPQCKGFDNSKPVPKTFSDYSHDEQACMCAIGQDASPFMKCDPLCPPGNMEKIATDSAALATVYCKPDGSGPLSSGSSSASSKSFSHLASVVAATIVLSAAVLV